MQSTWGVAEARAQFGKVLEEARRGRDQVITSRGGGTVRVTSSHTPVPRSDHLHYLIVALAERDAGNVALAVKGGGRELSHVRFITETSADMLVWLFDEFGTDWCADYVRAMLLSLRALQKTLGISKLATLSDVMDGLRRSTYNSRLASIVSSESFGHAVRVCVVPAFPEQDRRAALGHS
jgi:prevent-host-death family protein